MPITLDGTNGITFPSGSAVSVGLTTMASKPSTSGSSVEFTDIPAGVKRITILLQGVSTTGTSNLQVQLGTGSTPTYTTSGYLGAISNTGNVITNFSSGFLLSNNVGAADVHHGIVTVANVSGNNWCQSGFIGLSNNTAARYSAGSIALAAALTAIRVTTADAFDAGTINVLYE